MTIGHGGTARIHGNAQRPAANASGGTPWDLCGCELPTFCIQSVEITQHLAPMVNTLLRPFRRWPAIEAALARLAGRFTTWPSDESDRFLTTSMRGTERVGPAARPPAADLMRRL